MPKEILECPYCGEQVRYGLTICRGCQAQVHYGATNKEAANAGCWGCLLGTVLGFIVIYIAVVLLSFIGLLRLIRLVGLPEISVAFVVCGGALVCGLIAFLRASNREEKKREGEPRFFRRFDKL